MPNANIKNIESALSFIPPHADRDEWVTMGMAVKSELGDAGFELWDAWSQRADSYKPRDARDTWRSIKAAGGVTIGSLFHAAKAAGWTPETPIHQPTAEEAAQLAAKRAAEAERAATEKSHAQAAASTRADKKWAAAQPARADHPYALTKSIQPTGAREADGWLLVPLSAGGKLVNLQSISATGEKRFMKGGRVAGASVTLGECADARAWLLCEGWATGCSLHEATGLPVVVAFNADNLKKVAEVLANSAAAPDASIIVCGDLDESGTGQKAARAAAEKIGARAAVCLPEFEARHREEAKPTDFNDMARLYGAQAVCARVTLAVDALEATRHRLNYVKQAPVTPDAGAQANQPQTPAPAVIAYGFILKEGGSKPGVYRIDPDDEKPPRWLCAPLHVVAKTRDATGSNWGLLLRWSDPDGGLHEWAMPAEMPRSDGSTMVQELARGGLEIAAGRGINALITEYVLGTKPGARALCTSRTGWNGDAFVMHGEVIGASPDEQIVLQGVSADTSGTDITGTLEGWRDGVASMASHNSRLLFAISAAFAAPLMRFSEDDGGGFNLFGTSSEGKSTAAIAAASVWGPPAAYVHKWRATLNGIEGMCAARNDMLIVLDEIGLLDPKEAGDAAYVIADGKGKSRSDRYGNIRMPQRWRTLILSTGETTLADHMEGAGKRVRAGQAARLADIVANAGAGLGVLDDLRGRADGHFFAEELKRRAGEHHGSAGRAFIRSVLEHMPMVLDSLKSGRESMLRDDVPKGASGQVLRTASRFALVGVAGELATHFGLTGWRPGEASKAAERLLKEWIGTRGGAGDIEISNGLAAVRAFIAAHGESRFSRWDDHGEPASKTINRAGFSRHVGGEVEYYIFQEAFREACRESSPVAVAKEMARRGWLEASGDGRLAVQKRLPGGVRARVYLITPRFWDGE